MPPPVPHLLRIDAAAAVDPTALVLRPASLLLDLAPTHAEILAVGNLSDVASHPASSRALSLHLPASLLLPAFVNAHSHLDLTCLAPRSDPSPLAFVPWLESVRTRRPQTEQAIQASVRRGIELSIAGGTVALGDIAGLPASGHTLAPLRALRASPLAGVSFLEFFAFAVRATTGIERMEAFVRAHAGELEPADGVRAGLQPHAPYSVDPRGYAAAHDLARELDLPLSTHLAETSDECRFITRGEGPLADFLRSLGMLSAGEPSGWKQSPGSPVAHLAEAVDPGQIVLVHCNRLTDADIELLARARARVVLCPRASRSFASACAHMPHRYPDLLQSGVTVALGTDSLACLPPSAADPARGGISILDEMRVLHAEGRVAPRVLLEMATTNGARVLGLEADQFAFRPGCRLGGLVHVPLPASRDAPEDPLRAVLESGFPVRPIVLRGRYLAEQAGRGMGHDL